MPIWKRKKEKEGWRSGAVKAEGAFGDIKKNFGYSLLRRRGESGVRVELGLVILGYNLRHYHRQRTKLMK